VTQLGEGMHELQGCTSSDNIYFMFAMERRNFTVINQGNDKEQTSTFLDSQHCSSYGNHNSSENDRSFVISSFDDEDSTLSPTCSIKSASNRSVYSIPLKQIDENFKKCSWDVEENASCSDSSCGEFDEESDFRNHVEGRDDDTDIECIVFRRKEIDSSLPPPNNHILKCNQLDCSSHDESSSTTDMWTLKRAHPISEDDGDSSFCSIDGAEIDSSGCDDHTPLSTSFVVSFESYETGYILNPRKKQKQTD
jgi:hypothetical protein